MKKTILILAIFLLSTAAVLAQEGHNNEIEEGKKLVESKISCDKLSNEQLEAIGDYYMEQMHPGEAHELMDNMMGGEGSESLRQVHINMAKGIYCGESSGMMQMMMNMGGSGGGMMNNYPGYYDSYKNSFNVTIVLVNTLLLVLIVAVIVWLVKSLMANQKGK